MHSQNDYIKGIKGLIKLGRKGSIKGVKSTSRLTTQKWHTVPKPFSKLLWSCLLPVVKPIISFRPQD